MTNEVDAFLGLDEKENTDPFNTIKEDPFTTETVKPETEQKEEDAKPLPFHKDPKVQRYIAKEIAKATADMKPEQRVETTDTNEEEALVKAFEKIIGSDTDDKKSALDLLGKTIKGVRESASLKVMRDLEAQTDAQKREEYDAQQEIADAFEDIEENFGVDITSNTTQAKKTRSEFIDFVKEVSKKDEDGEVIDFPDFQNTFALFQKMQKPASNDRAKQLSANSMQRSTDASASAPTGPKNWAAVDKLFSKLGK